LAYAIKQPQQLAAILFAQRRRKGRSEANESPVSTLVSHGGQREIGEVRGFKRTSTVVMPTNQLADAGGHAVGEAQEALTPPPEHSRRGAEVE
jgi:hypothetical protein